MAKTIAVLVILLWTSSASAQIVNTLRGFDEDARGWAGDVQAAVAVADGNTNYFEFELVGAVQHRGDRNRWRLLGRHMRRTASDETVADSRMAHLRHNFRLSRRLATIAFLQTQYEPFQRIESRTLVGVGARFDLFKGVRWHTALGATAMLENDELTDTGRTTNAGRLSLFLTVFRDVDEGVDIDIIGFYQPRIDQPDDARANIVANLRVDILGELYAIFRYSAAYDSSPAPGVEELDQNLRAGFGYEL